WLEGRDVSGEQIDRLLGHAAGSVRRRHYSTASVEALARAVTTIQLDLGSVNESSEALTKRRSDVEIGTDREPRSSEDPPANHASLPSPATWKTVVLPLDDIRALTRRPIRRVPDERYHPRMSSSASRETVEMVVWGTPIAVVITL